MNREGQVERTTKETRIKLSLRLSGDGSGKIGTGVPEIGRASCRERVYTSV